MEGLFLHLLKSTPSFYKATETLVEKRALPPNSKLYILITIYGPTQMRLHPDPVLEDSSNCMTNLHEKSNRLLQIMWCIFPVQHYSKNFRL